MNMRVDAAGDDIFAAGIDDAVCLKLDRAGRGEGDDASVLDADVEGLACVGRDHRAASDQGIEHLAPPFRLPSGRRFVFYSGRSPPLPSDDTPRAEFVKPRRRVSEG